MGHTSAGFPQLDSPRRPASGRELRGGGEKALQGRKGCGEGRKESGQGNQDQGLQEGIFAPTWRLLFHTSSRAGAEINSLIEGLLCLCSRRGQMSSSPKEALGAAVAACWPTEYHGYSCYSGTPGTGSLELVCPASYSLSVSAPLQQGLNKSEHLGT